MEFAKIVEERDQLYDTFEGAVKAVQQKSDFRYVAANVLLCQMYVRGVTHDEAGGGATWEFMRNPNTEQISLGSTL